jgi:hypothetical protein
MTEHQSINNPLVEKDRNFTFEDVRERLDSDVRFHAYVRMLIGHARAQMDYTARDCFMAFYAAISMMEEDERRNSRYRDAANG